MRFDPAAPAMIFTRMTIHTSWTYAHQHFTADDIYRWHTDPKPRGNGWSDNGYHIIIRRDALIEAGRPMTRMGAHVGGHNFKNLGVCLIGGRGDDDRPDFNYTWGQIMELKWVVNWAQRRFPGIELFGHRDFDPDRKCPCFSVKEMFQ